MPPQVTIKKAIALVVALGKLHNFCIDFLDTNIPSLHGNDEWVLQLEGGIPDAPVPNELLDAGNHFDDMDGPARRRWHRSHRNHELPRNRLHEQVANANLTRLALLV